MTHSLHFWLPRLSKKTPLHCHCRDRFLINPTLHNKSHTVSQEFFYILICGKQHQNDWIQQVRGWLLHGLIARMLGSCNVPWPFRAFTSHYFLSFLRFLYALARNVFIYTSMLRQQSTDRKRRGEANAFFPLFNHPGLCWSRNKFLAFRWVGNSIPFYIVYQRQIRWRGQARCALHVLLTRLLIVSFQLNAYFTAGQGTKQFLQWWADSSAGYLISSQKDAHYCSLAQTCKTHTK